MAAIKVVRTIYREVETKGLKKAVDLSGWDYKALSLAIGEHDQYISRLCRGLTKSIPEERFEALVDALVGHGAFEHETREAVLAVIEGQGFRLSLVTGRDDDGRPVVDRARDDKWVAGESNPEPTD